MDIVASMPSTEYVQPSPGLENCFPSLLGTLSTRELFTFYVGAGRLVPPKNLSPFLFAQMLPNDGSHMATCIWFGISDIYPHVLILKLQYMTRLGLAWLAEAHQQHMVQQNLPTKKLMFSSQSLSFLFFPRVLLLLRGLFL